MNVVMKLSEVLESANEIPWNEALYLPMGRQWTLESPAIVWDPDDVEDDEQELPDFPAEHGMTYVLGINAVQDIVSNLQQQKVNCSVEEKVAALMHYIRNDAFIKL